MSCVWGRSYSDEVSFLILSRPIAAAPTHARIKAQEPMANIVCAGLKGSLIAGGGACVLLMEEAGIATGLSFSVRPDMREKVLELTFRFRAGTAFISWISLWSLMSSRETLGDGGSSLGCVSPAFVVGAGAATFFSGGETNIAAPWRATAAEPRTTMRAKQAVLSHSLDGMAGVRLFSRELTGSFLVEIAMCRFANLCCHVCR